MERNAILADQRDIFEQQSYHPFAFAVGHGGIAPQLWEAMGQREDRRSLLVIDDFPILFSLTFTKLLRFSQHLQFAILIGLERIGYEPVVGVHS